MAFHILENGKRFTFMSYILSESIRPTPTSFGTNEETNNNQIIRYDDPTEEISTFFKESNGYYMVTIRLENGEILLEHSNHYSTNPADYSMDRYQTQKALLVFGKTLYVALLLITKFKLTQFCFIESNPALGSVYKRLSHNEFFLRDIAQFGFGYAGENDGYHIFKKVFGS